MCLCRTSCRTFDRGSCVVVELLTGVHPGDLSNFLDRPGGRHDLPARAGRGRPPLDRAKKGGGAGGRAGARGVSSS